MYIIFFTEKPVGDFAKEFIEFRFNTAPEYATKFGIVSENEDTRSGVTDIGDAAADRMLVSELLYQYFLIRVNSYYYS